MRTAAFPDLPFVTGTGDGDVYTQLVNGQPSGAKVHICSGSISALITYERLVLAACGNGIDDPAWYLWDSRTTTVTMVAKTVPGWTAAFSGTGGVVYVELGRYEPGAPIGMTRLMLYDLASRRATQIDEGYVVANDLRLTGEGLAVWRAKFNPNGVRTDAEAGTWLLRGRTLVKYSQHQLIASANGLAVLESEPAGWPVLCCHVVYTRTAVEQRLSPAVVTNEYVVALLDDGRILTWRPATDIAGEMVIYENGQATRIDSGSFNNWRMMRSGDWVIAGKPWPDPALLAYRISDGSFASIPVTPGAFTSIAMLGTRP